MTRTNNTNKRKNGFWPIASILLAGLGALAPTAQAQNFDGSGGGGSLNVPGPFQPGGWTPPPQQPPPPPSVFQRQAPPPGAIWQQQDEDRQRAAAAEAARQEQVRREQAQREAEARAAQARREQEERALAAALQRARDEFEHGKRAALGAMKGVGHGEGFKGLGGNTNFFSLKGFKPIPRGALSTSLERAKAQTSQCFDVGGCAPVSLPPFHLGSPHDLSAVPAWVQQTPQYQALAATVQQLEAQAAEKARALQAAQQALEAGPAEQGSGQAQVTALQTQVANLQEQIASQKQQLLNLAINLTAEGPSRRGR